MVAGIAGLISLLLGVYGMRVDTRCSRFFFAGVSGVVAVVYLSAMIMGEEFERTRDVYLTILCRLLTVFMAGVNSDGALSALLDGMEACHEQPKIKDCGVVLGSCSTPNYWDANAALCAYDNDADCGCVTDELDCYTFVSQHARWKFNMQFDA